MAARKPAQGVTDDVQPDAAVPEDVQPDAAVPDDVTAGTRLTSPDGEVHLIVPEGVQALLALGWTESE